MLFRTHFVVALFLFLMVYRYFSNIFLFGLFLLFATLFVDIDSSKSKMGKIIFFRPLQLIFSHRGIFHSLVFGVFVSSLIFVFNSSAGFGFLLGYLLHLFLDCFSLSGVRLFWPFSRKKIKGFVKTGGIFEEILFVLVLLIDVYLVVKIGLNILF
jgi:inner membrane protein